MPQALSMDELLQLIPREALSHGGNATTTVPEGDDGESSEEENVLEVVETSDEETEEEKAGEEAVLDQEPPAKLAVSTPFANKVKALEAQVKAMAEEMAQIKEFYKNELDLLRGRTDRLSQESEGVRRQLANRGDAAVTREIGRLRNALDLHIQRGHR